MKLKVLFICLLMALCTSCATTNQTTHRAAAEELLQLTNPEAMMTQVWEQINGLMEQQYQQMGAPEELKPLFKKYSDKMFLIVKDELSFQNMKEDLVTVYTNTYTQKELQDISKFYQSPAGQAFLEKMPKLMEESFAISQKKMGPLMEKIQLISMEFKTELEKKIAGENEVIIE